MSERQTIGKPGAGKHSLPPAIVFHGNDNALSIVRSLGRRSIPVYVLNERDSDVASSRFARRIRLDDTLPFKQAALRFLTSSESDSFAGAVLLAASDDALEMIAQNRATLENKFRLDLSNPTAQLKMLDKLATYEMATAAGVPTPRYWRVGPNADPAAFQSELVYPLIVKPLLSHVFQKKFSSNKKFLVAEQFEDVVRALQMTREADVEVLLLEKIPGPDSKLCSYYTYLDEHGTPLFDFTKRIIRRFPTNMGLATYHITDHVPEVKEHALRLFQAAGLRGLANAEFKYDDRDKTLKLIECNARFTAANGLVARAGLDLSSLVYNRLVGLPLPPLNHYRDNLTLWDPMRDFKAFRELQREGKLTLFQWLSSVSRPHVLPAFQCSDPGPAWARFRRRIWKSS